MAEQLSYGCNRALPDGVRVAWGARLIAPADLVWNRQSWGGTDGGELPEHSSHESGPRTALAAWLNGGALRQAIDNKSRELRLGVADPSDDAVHVLYEDAQGVILGSPQGSHGYVYVAAWLFRDVPGDSRGYEVTGTGRVLTDQDFHRLAAEEVGGDGR